DASLQKPDQGILDNVFPGTWYKNPLRHFTLQLYIYDGLTGQLLDQPFYQTQAQWTFDREAIVDPISQDFWQSSYGMEVTATLNRVTEELKGRLQCERPTARIIRVEGLDYHINLGKNNGLKVGDRFRILHKADFTDPDGREHPLRNAASGTMEVSKVYAENAVLRPLSQYAPGNIQVSDLAELE
ncbi:MAG: FlgT C-terminal domain-containing protein, partial [Tolumonas sp.]|nr:FlgT C-terminal domain-containing protein [Tolumonas sp.]